jgi:antitoxin MazE
MKIAKWGNSLALRIPKDVAEALALREGDDVEVYRRPDNALEVGRKPTTEELLESIRRIAKPLPPGWKFDREEANAR